MKLLVLRDKKPGHFNQAEGVALAIGRMSPVAVHRIDIRPSWFAHDDVRKIVMRRYARDAAKWVKLMYGIDAAALERPDAIIGSGRPTIAAGILLARLFGVPFIYSGFIGGYDTSDVALQIVSSPRQAGHPRCAYALIPSVVDPDALPAPRLLRSPADLAGADLALLIGGTAYRRKYEDAEWQSLVRLVREVSAHYGVRWRVSNSRRTPDEVGDMFAGLLARGEIAEFIDYRQAGAGSVRHLFGADAIVVTEDSMSMLAEGITARRPVIGLKSARVQDHYANEAISSWAAGPSLAILPLATATAGQLATTLCRLRASEQDVRDALAAVVAPVLGLTPPGRLQLRDVQSVS